MVTLTTMKPLLLLLFLVAYHVCPSFSQQQCSGSDFYTSTVKGKDTRLTYLEDGNYTIQALLYFSLMNTSCSVVSKSGLSQMFTIRYAISKFNDHPFYGSRARIGLQLDDSCGQLPTTMARGIEVVSFHRNNSVCRSDFIRCNRDKVKNVTIREASAVIGTSMSFTTIPLSSLMSLYDIPQVSPSASSRLLSKRELYKSFFRTISSDTNQIRAMLSIFKRFKWNYIFAVGSDDDYGKLGVSDLKQLTGSSNGDSQSEDEKICIFKDEYIPYSSEKTKNKIEEVVAKIKEGTKAKVVVLFLYVQSIGEQIIAEAKRQNVERIWLTSEAWNPAAAEIFSNQLELRNQTHGILSVSLQRQNLPDLKAYIEREIRTNYMCNQWLLQYIERVFRGCKVTTLRIQDDVFECTDGNTVNVSEVVDHFEQLPGPTDRLIDAAYSLGLAMHTVLNDTCPDPAQPCQVNKLEPSRITAAMNGISFKNNQGVEFSYDKGEPKTSFYTIDNLVFDGSSGKMVYKQIGNWTFGNLKLDANAIQWPYWFKQNDSENSFPESRCSPECKPGQYVVGRTGCCWTCHECQSYKNYTDKPMMEKCLRCDKYYHTLNHRECIPTQIKWLEVYDPAGMSIVIISGIGFLFTLVATIFIAKHNALVTKWDTSKHMLSFVCVLLFLTFVYGPLHITEPNDVLCKIRNGYFFILLMMYCAFVLVQTQAMTSYLKGHAERTFGGHLLVTQLFVLFMFFLLELVSIIAWLYVDGNQLNENRDTSSLVIWKQCQVEFTAARLVSTFIPCIILIIATFCAFRERNADHSFYEPKFLSFSCIALCIIIVAFLPTFRYVLGIYKAIVLAYTMNVFGFTFLVCLILPKVYVGFIRKRRGENEYPPKTSASKRKKKKDDKKPKKGGAGGGAVAGGGQVVDTSNYDASIAADSPAENARIHHDPNSSSEASSASGDIKMEEKQPVAGGVADEVAYRNGGQNGSVVVENSL